MKRNATELKGAEKAPGNEAATVVTIFPRLIWLHTFSFRNSRHSHFPPLASMNFTGPCSNYCLNFHSHDLPIFECFAPFLLNGCQGERTIAISLSTVFLCHSSIVIYRLILASFILEPGHLGRKRLSSVRSWTDARG